MRLPTLISLPNEPALEKWARLFRYRKADGLISQELQGKGALTLVDFGCGQDISYHKYLGYTFGQKAKKIHYIGLDPLLPKSAKKSPNIELIKAKFEDVHLKEKADLITMFAVLEHVDDPLSLVREACMVLKPGGTLIITTPAPLARFSLEFFSYFLGIISTREIDEHKRYPTKESLLHIVAQLQKVGLRITATHTYFELGLNNLLIIRKTT